MEAFLIIIAKCLLLGVIWAALLIPTFCKSGSPLKYALTVVVVALLCFFFRGWAGIINKMTVIALITLVVAWILSMAVFDRQAKIKSQVISFCCVLSALAYLISQWVDFAIL